MLQNQNPNKGKKQPEIKPPEKQQPQQSIFHDFYNKLKSDKALPVRKEIEQFVKTILPKIIKPDVQREDQGHHVQELMNKMLEKFLDLFPPRTNSEEEM